MRNLEGCLLDIWLLLSEHKIVEAMEAAYGNYEEGVKDNPNHTLGSPDIHRFLAMLAALFECDIGSSNRKFLTDLSHQLQPLSPQLMANYVKLCTIKPSGDDKMKISLYLGKEEWRYGIVECFKALAADGIDHKTGRPPASGLEDELSKYLTQLSI